MLTEDEIKRIEVECNECLSDRTQFCDENGVLKIVECDHCRDKMNLIGEIRRLEEIIFTECLKFSVSPDIILS